jgi:hypothetical protein
MFKRLLPIFVSCLWLLVILELASCGKFAPPIAPEKAAPQGVGALAVQTTDSAVIIQWTTPETDRRNKQLKQIDGYSIYRKTVASKKDIADEQIPFDKLAEVGDKAIADRETRRLEAIELGAISRRVKIDPALAAHQYEDKTPQAGTSYLYKVVPLNQNGVEGEVRQFISITFRGASSDINIVTAKELGVDDFVSTEEQPLQ